MAALRKMPPLLLLLLLLACALPLQAGTIAPGLRPWGKEVLLHQEETETTVRFEGENRTEMPVTFWVEITGLENARPSQEPPFVWVLEAGSHRTLFHLERVDPARPWSHTYDWRFCPGDPEARHDDDHLYRLPFETSTPRMVLVGWNNASIHAGAYRYALDFEMSWGTPVLAARAGTVVLARDRFSIGGAEPWLLPQANRVTLLHDDGTFADYVHLRQGGALVELGERVEAGRRIGLSGMTGFAVEPHLHFMVWKAIGEARWVSLPTRFDDGTPDGLVPEEGMGLPLASPVPTWIPPVGLRPWMRSVLP